MIQTEPVGSSRQPSPPAGRLASLSWTSRLFSRARAAQLFRLDRLGQPVRQRQPVRQGRASLPCQLVRPGRVNRPSRLVRPGKARPRDLSPRPGQFNASYKQLVANGRPTLRSLNIFYFPLAPPKIIYMCGGGCVNGRFNFGKKAPLYIICNGRLSSFQQEQSFDSQKLYYFLH